MKVKISDIWYDANNVPIMILLTQKDKENLANMHPDFFKYASFPDDVFTTKEDTLKWMEVEYE